MTTKKQKIIEAILKDAKRLARETLTAKQLETLKQFIERRLDTHGKNGYMFKTVVSYNKQLVPVDDTRMLAAYVLNNNFIKIDK